MNSFTVILMIAVTIIAMAFVGWISFTTFEDGASININTTEIKKDAETIAEKSENLIENTADKGQDFIKSSDGSKPAQRKEAKLSN